MIAKLNSTNGKILLNSTDGRIFLGNPGKTADPTINFVGWSAPSGSPQRVTAYWTVTNEDSFSAQIYSEDIDSTPDVSIGTIASGATTSTISGSNTIFTEFTAVTIYAYAKASVKEASDIVSLFVSYY